MKMLVTAVEFFEVYNAISAKNSGTAVEFRFVHVSVSSDILHFLQADIEKFVLHYRCSRRFAL